jgi:hypothetical protein
MDGRTVSDSLFLGVYQKNAYQYNHIGHFDIAHEVSFSFPPLRVISLHTANYSSLHQIWRTFKYPGPKDRGLPFNMAQIQREC